MRRPIRKMVPRIAGGAKRHIGIRRGFLERAKEIEAGSKVGYDTAEVFPWYRSGIAQETGFALTTGIRTPVRPLQAIYDRSLGEEAFKNDTDGIIEIHKLAFQAYRGNSPLTILPFVSVKIESEEKTVLKKWVPITALQTDPDRGINGELNQGVWRLPTPYFLAAQSVFTGALTHGQTATLDDKTLTICLRGYNPIDLDPIVMTTTTTFPEQGGNGFTPFSFTENRDGPLRDMVVEDITIGLSDIYDTLTRGYFLDQTNIRFEPPEGPQWCKDPYTPFSNLAKQVSVVGGGAGAYSPSVVHEPIEPYILEPGQSLKMEILPQRTLSSTYIVITAIGTQRGRRSL